MLLDAVDSAVDDGQAIDDDDGDDDDDLHEVFYNYCPRGLHKASNITRPHDGRMNGWIGG